MGRKITVVPRPFTLTFRNTGQSYPITSVEAQRLIDEYPAVTATANRVVLQGHNSAKASDCTVLWPATRGGGPAFIIDREAPSLAGRERRRLALARHRAADPHCTCNDCIAHHFDGETR